MADDGDILTLDNKAVGDHGLQHAHWETSDMAYRVALADALKKKKVALKWIPGHRQLSQDRASSQNVQPKCSGEGGDPSK